MKWNLAVRRAWKVPVVWEAADEPPAIAAEVVTAAGRHVHYHLHLAPGMSPAEVAALMHAAGALPQRRDAITEGVERTGVGRPDAPLA